MGTRRIWCETVPYPALREPRVGRLLRRYGLGAIVAVRPTSLPDLARTVRALEGEGVEVALWPMLEDADGRWVNARNVDAFVAFARAVMAACERPAEICVDLEPSIARVRAARIGVRGAARLLGEGADLERARGVLDALLGEIRARGFVASAAVMPMVLLDGWESILGTPVRGLLWARINVMLYTSILEGWSRGLLAREDAVSVFAGTCRAASARYEARASVSLGAVGTGAFGDEPVYRDAAELARDAAIARACGVDDLALFELGGVLSRPPAEAWLEAFVQTSALTPIPRPTLRSRAALSVAGATSYLAPLLRFRP